MIGDVSNIDIDELIEGFEIDEGDVESFQGCGCFVMCLLIVVLALSQHPEIINKCFGN